MASNTGAADAAAALLDMDVSADDYAKTAATDQAVSSAARDARTHQSEEDFAQERANYQAKIDNGDVSFFLLLLPCTCHLMAFFGSTHYRDEQKC